jgi:hypothetical protein
MVDVDGKLEENIRHEAAVATSLAQESRTPNGIKVRRLMVNLLIGKSNRLGVDEFDLGTTH